MPSIQRLIPCLWFDDQAEHAAKFYVSVFDTNSRIIQVSHFPNAGQEVHGKPAGSVMTVEFELFGCSLTALNGGPQFKFTEAVSLQVMCDTQAEIDHLWDQLSSGGDASAQACGWLKDKFGLSWQIVPTMMAELFTSDSPEKAERAMKAMLPMKKLVIADLKRAYDG